MTDIIKIDNLTFNYPAREDVPEHCALRGISLAIEEGSFVAVLGQNGSGKSTLAKCLNALILPTEGDVTVAGHNTKDEAHLWDIRQSVGMVFQNPDNQIVSAIVEDDVAFGPENMGVPSEEIRKRVDDALEAVDMSKFKKNAPHLLSGGQKQRVAIAGAIAMKPRCIVFDEPTAMLDPKGRKEILGIISELKKEGITCILITHFMEETIDADRIIILKNGEVYMDDTPLNIYKDEEKLIAAGMRLPFAVKVRKLLEQKGFALDENSFRKEDIVQDLCRLK